LVRNLDDLAGAAPDATVVESDAAVTDAPDGTRWVGLSAAREALLIWGAHRGATRAYLAVPEQDDAGPAESLGFRLHHRRRYVDARSIAWDTV
jgi:N-acetylglutamate synthase